MSDVNGTYFAGKTWLIYGRLPNIAKKSSTAAITDRGGQIVKAVSGKLDFLVMEGPTPLPGKAQGAKATQAEAVGAKIIGESDFLRLIEGEDPFAPGSQPELSPLPDALAALTYPGEDVDLDATYFDGKTWGIYGTLTHDNGWALAKGDVGTHLERRGAKLTRRLAKADFIAHEGETPLWGSRLSEDVQAARDRGVPIFGTADFIGLLFDGMRPLNPENNHDPTEHEAFGELRALIQSAGDTLEQWDEIKEALEGLNNGALEGALAYTNAHIDRLPREKRFDASTSSYRGWLSFALKGDDNPLLSVVRAAHVWEKISKAQSEALFSCTNLSRLERYTIRTDKPAPQHHWTMLAGADHLQNLTSLRASKQRLSKKVAEQLVGSGRLSKLIDLDLDACEFKKGVPSALFTQGSMPALANLRLSQTHGEEMLSALATMGMEGIERLDLGERGTDECVLDILSHPTTRELVGLTLDNAQVEHSTALASGPALEGLRELKVSFQGAPSKALFEDERLASLEHLTIELHDMDGPFLQWLVTRSVIANGLVKLDIKAKNLDWTQNLRHAQMPKLKHIRLDMPGKSASFPLRTVFPALERSRHNQWKDNLNEIEHT